MISMHDMACIVRDDEVLYPRGNMSIQLGDDIVIVTTLTRFDAVNDILENERVAQ
ncbi:MAG TPA: hypothetical protein GX734_04750 [Clostridiaceae bacterium]|nr:hypothetical protein [Clostridiaceae bacterium]